MTRKLSIQNFLFALIVGVAIGITPIQAFATTLWGYAENIDGAEVYVKVWKLDKPSQAAETLTEGGLYSFSPLPADEVLCVNILPISMAGLHFYGIPRSFRLESPPPPHIRQDLSVYQGDNPMLCSY